jgi:hypothetical protein
MGVLYRRALQLSNFILKKILNKHQGQIGDKLETKHF